MGRNSPNSPWVTTRIYPLRKSGRQVVTERYEKNPFAYKKGTILWSWIFAIAVFIGFAIGIIIFVMGVVNERKKNGDKIYDFEKNSE